MIERFAVSEPGPGLLERAGDALQDAWRSSRAWVQDLLVAQEQDLKAAAAGAVAAGVLYIFFRSVRHRWPEHYSTLSGVLEASVNRSVLRYLAFRSLPVYFAGVFLGATVDRLRLNAALALACMTVLHVGFTNGRAVLRLFSRSSRDPRKASLSIYYILSALIVVLTALLAGWSYGLWRRFIPSPEDVVVSLWTGLFAAVLAAYILSLKHDHADAEGLIAQARTDVGTDVWEHIDVMAWKHDCEADVLRAIVVVESLQRPAWVRRLERAMGRVSRRGSYGVAQMTAAEPLSDKESVEALAVSFEGYYPERSSNGHIKRERMEARVERHNRKAAFIETFRDVFFELHPVYVPNHSTARALDGRPIIEVVSVEREGAEWALRGTACVHEANIVWASFGDNGATGGQVTATIGAPHRGRWELRLPLAARRVTLAQEAMEEDATAALEMLVEVDLD